MNRSTQLVKIKDNESDLAVVTSGVPQGSYLRPLPFILFINNVADNSKCDHCFNIYDKKCKRMKKKFKLFLCMAKTELTGKQYTSLMDNIYKDMLPIPNKDVPRESFHELVISKIILSILT